MEDYKFQHELTPELRGQAALENQRLAFIAEFEDARTRLVTQLRRWLLCIGLLLLPAILNVLLPPVLSLLVMLVCLGCILYLMRGNNVIRLFLILREMRKAKRRIKDWEVITKDVVRTHKQHELK